MKAEGEGVRVRDPFLVNASRGKLPLSGVLVSVVHAQNARNHCLPFPKR